MMIYTDIILHPELGEIFVYWGTDGKIKEVSFEGSHLDVMAIPGDFSTAMPEVRDYLLNFGENRKPAFTPDILDLSWCTGFMEMVYRTLFRVPRGTTVAYGKLAEMAGFPRAARAVGTAMRKNKFALIIPCHRVVGANSPGSYLSSMSLKIKLLRMEGVDI